MPPGRVVVVINRAGAPILILYVPAALEPAESATVALKEKLPACDGVPESEPLELIAIPGGRLPDAMDHVYGGVPPVADNEPE